jgi:cytochrome c-type biogenesis protein CcmH
MTTFIILAMIMAVIATAFVAVPLLRRRGTSALAHDSANVAIYQDQLAELNADLANGTLSQGEFEHARNELERRLLQDVQTPAPQDAPMPTASAPRWPAFGAMLAIPLVAGVLYWQLGSPSALTIPSDPVQARMHQVESLLPRLEQHLVDEPNDVQGWTMLGKTYMVLERYPDAVRAYDKLAQLAPNDAQVLADYADALAMAQGQNLAGKPAQLLAQALKLDPTNGKALYMSGFAALAANDPKQAAKYWNALLTQLPPNSEDAQVVRQHLAEIGQQPEARARPSATSPSVSGTVKLEAALQSKVQPGDTVFIFARAAQGPRMPLAVLRLQAKDLPASFTLDDSMAMSPQMKLSSFPEIVVGARISRSGNAVSQPGDLEGNSAPTKVGATGVAVSIDRVIP